MIIGEKESFLIRALEKKLSENNINNFYCEADVAKMGKYRDNMPLMVYYLNAGENPPTDFMHYMKEYLSETGTQIILIGDKADTDNFKKTINPSLIGECYTRPLDTTLFLYDVRQLIAEGGAENTRKRVLVVDDDTEFLGVVREWLKEKYQVFMANSGMQAIKMLAASKVDLILLDYEMPITSGPQVLEMIRSDEDTAGIPVIFLTGRNDKESVMTVIGLKPEGYILKTSGRDALMAKVGEFFAR